MNCPTCNQPIKGQYVEPPLEWLQQQSKRWIQFQPVQYWWEILGKKP